MRKIAPWIVSILLALAFLGAGLAKLSSQPMMVAEFTSFGFGLWFMYFTGALEVVCAILVLIPRTAAIGAALLTCIMICAIATHLTHGQAGLIGAPVVLLVLAVTLGLLRGWRTMRLIPA
jgi:uncharacterized membrane protein YphA (DoxX/SURF4 family)